MLNDDRRAGGRSAYKNAVLTGIALMLAMIVADRGGVLPGPAAANAESGGFQPEGGALTSAADQRKQIIAELARLNQAVSRLESKLSGGLEVKVTSMPAMKAGNASTERAPSPERAAPEKP